MRPLDIRKRFTKEGLRRLSRCEVRFEVATSQKRHDEAFVLRVHSEIVLRAAIAPLGSEPTQHGNPRPRKTPDGYNGTSRSWPKCGPGRNQESRFVPGFYIRTLCQIFEIATYPVIVLNRRRLATAGS
jgi:hypothetical protein